MNLLQYQVSKFLFKILVNTYKLKKIFNLLKEYCYKCKNVILDFFVISYLLTRLKNIYPNFAQLSITKMFTIPLSFPHLSPSLLPSLMTG